MCKVLHGYSLTKDIKSRCRTAVLFLIERGVGWKWVENSNFNLWQLPPF